MSGRNGVASLLAAVLLIAAAGCSVVTRTHRATVVEAPTTGEAAPLTDRWVVQVRLADGEIAGAEEVVLGFHHRALLCDDGSELAPDDLEVGTTVRFVREGDDVDTSNPPGVAAREIRAEC